MKSDHRTHFLFLEPENPPSLEPVEDELTEKVDYIFSQLILSPSGGYRGCHTTPFGKRSDNQDYIHPVFLMVSNSLAPYYVRHHREDLSQKQIDWINELYQILKSPNTYHDVAEKPVYYLKTYEKDPTGYGNAFTNAVKVVGSVDGVKKLIEDVFFRELTEDQFNSEIESATQKFEIQREGCSSILVYLVTKNPQ